MGVGNCWPVPAGISDLTRMCIELNRSSLVVACGALVLFACQQPLGVPEVEPALTTAAVVGGKEVSVCQFPSTVTVGGGGCTGTLIHPRVVTTAAHCLNGASSTIRFGGGRNDPGAFTVMGMCKSGARGQNGVGENSDWGYCVLPEDERLKKLPITPPLVGCEAERFLKAGANAWIVGYGTTGPNGQGGGVKRAVEVKVNRVSGGTVDVGDREVGACHGDSGGPIYMQLTDGANDYGMRVFGSTSGPGAAFCDCSCSTTYVDIAMHVKAIEENEKIDVTPCTDAAGKWAPGPECNAIQTQAMMGSGTFPDCMVARTTAPISSCGMGAAAAAGGGGGPATASGSAGAHGTAGVGAPSAAAGSGAAGGPGAGVAGHVAASGMAGVGARGAAAGSGAPGAGRGGAGLAATGVTSSSAGSAARAGSAAAMPTGTLTQGINAAGAPSTTGSMAPSPEDHSGCGVFGAPSRGDSARGLWCAIGGLWLTMRARRQRKRA